MGVEAKKGSIYLPGPTGGLEKIAEQYQISTEGNVAVARKPLFRGPEEDLFESILKGARGKRFLVLNAHPDDEIAKSGTTFRLIKEYGMIPDIATTTLGEHGTHNGTTRVVPSEMMRGIREQEMLKAAKVVGAEVYFFGKSDGGVEAGPDLVKGVAGLIREKRYELMLLVSGAEGEHPDHQATYSAGVEARKLAASSEEIEGTDKPPHFVNLMAEGQVMIINPDRFIHKVDTTPAALSISGHWGAHKSQLRDVRYENFFGKQWSFEAGLLGEGALLAEAYRVSNGHVKNEDLVEVPQYRPQGPVAHPRLLRV